KKAAYGDALGVKIPSKNRNCGARVKTAHGRIEREAREHGDEQTDAHQAQSRVRHAMKKPAKRCAFQRPTDRDPLAIELGRENQRDEKQGGSAKERQLRIACRTRERCAFEQHEESE